MFFNLYRYFTIEIIIEKLVVDQFLTLQLNLKNIYSLLRYILENLIAIFQSYYLCI